MGMSPFTGSGALCIDKLLGSAFEIVKYVADNLGVISSVAAKLPEIEQIAENVTSATAVFVTDAGLGGLTDAVNTTGKYQGKQAWGTTSNKLYLAMGDEPEADWISVDGASTITPA